MKIFSQTQQQKKTEENNKKNISFDHDSPFISIDSKNKI